MQELFYENVFINHYKKNSPVFAGHLLLVIKPEKLIKPLHERLFVKLKQVAYNQQTNYRGG